MGGYEDHCKFIGFFVLVIVVITLLSSPSLLLAKNVTVVGTELSYSTGNERDIRAKMDIGDLNCFSSFPKNISGWTSMDYDTKRYQEVLDADVLLMRRYKDPVSFKPVFFLITYSDNLSSFHPPIICYPSLGYTIIDESVENIPIRDVSWAEKPLYSTYENKTDAYFDSNDVISVKKLDLAKYKKDVLVERKVVLYFYLKNEYSTSNAVTLVRISAVVPSEDTYDDTLALCKNFAAEAMPHMFKIAEEDDSMAASLIKAGPVGWFGIVSLLLMPVGIMFYPGIKKRFFVRKH
jgi:hypothetical protein